MAKIKVEGTVVELDGDEMTRIIWQFIKDQLILPYLDVEPRVLRPRHRAPRRDRRPGHRSTPPTPSSKHGVGVKCATITPDEARVEEFGLKKMWRSPERDDPQHPRRRHLPRADHHVQRPAAGAGLDQADRHRPSRVRRPVPRHRLPVPRRGHADDHLHAEGRLASRSSSRSSSSPGGGVAMAMYNLDDSIRDFARASMRYGLQRELPGLPVDQEHDPQGLRRPVQGPVRRGLRDRVQGQVRGRRHHLRAPPDRRHGRRRR